MHESHSPERILPPGQWPRLPGLRHRLLAGMCQPDPQSGPRDDDEDTAAAHARRTIRQPGAKLVAGSLVFAWLSSWRTERPDLEGLGLDRAPMAARA